MKNARNTKRYRGKMKGLLNGETIDDMGTKKFSETIKVERFHETIRETYLF